MVFLFIVRHSVFFAMSLCPFASSTTKMDSPCPYNFQWMAGIHLWLPLFWLPGNKGNGSTFSFSALNINISFMVFHG